MAEAMTIMVNDLNKPATFEDVAVGQPFIEALSPADYIYHRCNELEIDEKAVNAKRIQSGKVVYKYFGDWEPVFIEGSMRLLDLFCGAGGAAMGYYRAGFTEIVGVDIAPQKRYPFEFVQGDALEYAEKYGREFDMIHASPPCQLYSVTFPLSKGGYPDLVGPTREALQATGKPYIIENVPRAPLINPIKLCGTMFPELRIRRHRLFECSPVIWWPPGPCWHWGATSACGRGKSKNNLTGYIPGTLENFDFITVTGCDYIAADGRKAMGIDWMTKEELSQAIPPAYTEWLGREMLKLI